MNSKNVFSFAVVIMLSFGVVSVSSANAATVVGPFSAHPPILKNINSTNATAQNSTNATAQTNIPSVSAQNVTNSNIVSIAPGTAVAGPNGTCITQNNCFNPHTINITTGQNVTWNNKDSVLHTVVSGKSTDSNSTIGNLFNKSIPPGGTVSIKFNSTGKINYFCQIHPWMKGEVVVKKSNTLHTSQNSGTNSQNANGLETNSSKNIINSSQNITNSSSQNSSNAQAGRLVTNSSNQTHS